MYSPQVFKKVKIAAKNAMDDLNIQPHESDAWHAVMAPYYELIHLMRNKVSRQDIINDYDDNTKFYQYAVFNAAYDAFLKATH